MVLDQSEGRWREKAAAGLERAWPAMVPRSNKQTTSYVRVSDFETCFHSSIRDTLQNTLYICTLLESQDNRHRYFYFTTTIEYDI